MMNEDTGVTASSLAITEKKPRKNGGCVGIFFQLFDWNRRFAKKKLFSKKLLPPARAKQASKKFGGDEKLPKLRLIADENSGGFPNVKRNGGSVEGKNGVRSPSLVARLMGLESMPSVEQEKCRKGSLGENVSGRREKVVSEDGEFEKGNSRHEFRPQKLQKTGMVERRPVTRFGAEALQLKNVLSRSRKHHHPKLASPVKSPRHHSGRNTSRLIGAATRILEPGMHSRSKAKCALTYTHNVRRQSGHEVMSESLKSVNPDAPGSSNYYTTTAKLLSGQSSCKNCGNLLDVVESRPMVEEHHPSVFLSSSQVAERSNSRYVHSSLEQEHKVAVPSDRFPLDHGGHIHGHLTSQRSDSQNLNSPNSFKDKPQRQANNSVRGETVPSHSNFSHLQFNRAAPSTNAVNDAKDFVALNRSSSGRTRLRVPAKGEEIKFDKRSKFDSRRDDCFSPVQKRRSMNARRQGEASNIITSSISKPRAVSNIPFAGKEMKPSAHSGNRTCTEDRPAYQGEGSRIGSSCKNTGDVTAFRFSSPTKQCGGIPGKMERRRDLNSSCKITPRRKSPLTGDTLGALLEEKLKEFTSQAEDESGSSGDQPKRSPAKIFQELICALNVERPPPQNHIESSPRRNYVPHNSLASNQKASFCFQAKPKNSGASAGYAYNTDHLSPGSILEASFSNDSCCSSSFDSSGHVLHADSLSYSFDVPQLSDFESDKHSGILSKEKTGRELVVDLLNYILEVICSIDLHNARLKGNKLSHAKGVIFDTELVLGNPVPQNSSEINVFSISHFILDELETLASVMWTNFSNFLGFEDTKEGNQLKGFLFDCLIEYLDSRYSRYSRCGFRAWTTLPPCMNGEILIHEVVEEVKTWMGLVRLIPDELIEWDMSHCLGKWTDFEIEEFETGAELGREILQTLVNEVVLDLLAGISCRCC